MEKDTVVIYKNDRNGNQLTTVNHYEIPEEKKGKPYIDVDVTLGSNRLNKNVVNHYNAENQLVLELGTDGKVKKRYVVSEEMILCLRIKGKESRNSIM